MRNENIFRLNLLASAVRGAFRRPLDLALLVAAAPSLVFAGPDGGAVVAGSATISNPTLDTTHIHQVSQQAILNWQNFSIGSNEYVQFQQPNSSAVALNRVVGGNPSSILGGLSANGQVFLVNPHGVFFGQGASVDVAGLVATTMAISDNDFLSGNYVFTAPAGGAAGQVVNQGVINANGGYVVLAGDYTANSGVIQARLGTVVLASGAGMTMDLAGDGLINLAVDEKTVADLAGVENSGQIIANGGTVLMTAKVADGLIGAAVNNSGQIQAQGVVEQGGEIYLVADGGDVVNSGLLDASGATDGGAVKLLSSHDVAVAAGAQIKADGGAAGTGGDIRLIAKNFLDFQDGASVSATGGASGGLVEVSGHGGIRVAGDVSLGAGGKYFIDPPVVTVTGGANLGALNTVYEEDIETDLNDGTDVFIIAAVPAGASAGASANVLFKEADQGGGFSNFTNGLDASGSGGLFVGIGRQTGGSSLFGLISHVRNAVGDIDLAGVRINIAGDLSLIAGSLDGDITLRSLGSAGSPNLMAKSIKVDAPRVLAPEVIAMRATGAGGAGIIEVTGDVLVGNAARVAMGLGAGPVNGALISLVGDGAVTVNGDLEASVSAATVEADFFAGAVVQSLTSTVDIDGDITASWTAPTANFVTVQALVLSGQSDGLGGPEFNPDGAGGDITVNGNILASADGVEGAVNARVVAFSDGAGAYGGDINLDGGSIRSVVTNGGSNVQASAFANAYNGVITQVAGHLVEVNATGVNVTAFGGLFTGVGGFDGAGDSLQRAGSGDIDVQGQVKVGAHASSNARATAAVVAGSDGDDGLGGAITLGAGAGTGGLVSAAADGGAGTADFADATAWVNAHNGDITQNASSKVEAVAKADGNAEAAAVLVTGARARESFAGGSNLLTSYAEFLPGYGNIVQAGEVSAIAIAASGSASAEAIVWAANDGAGGFGGSVTLKAGGLITASATGESPDAAASYQASYARAFAGAAANGGDLIQEAGHVMSATAEALNSDGEAYGGLATADLVLATGADVNSGTGSGTHFGGGDLTVAGANTVSAHGWLGASYTSIEVAALADEGSGGDGGDVFVTGGTFSVSAIKDGPTFGGFPSYASAGLAFTAEGGRLVIENDANISAHAAAVNAEVGEGEVSALTTLWLEGHGSFGTESPGITQDANIALTAAGPSLRGVVVAAGGLATGTGLITADAIAYNLVSFGTTFGTISYGTSNARFDLKTNAAIHLVSENLASVKIDNTAFTGLATLGFGSIDDGLGNTSDLVFGAGSLDGDLEFATGGDLALATGAGGTAINAESIVLTANGDLAVQSTDLFANSGLVSLDAGAGDITGLASVTAASGDDGAGDIELLAGGDISNSSDDINLFADGNVLVQAHEVRVIEAEGPAALIVQAGNDIDFQAGATVDGYGGAFVNMTAGGDLTTTADGAGLIQALNQGTGGAFVNMTAGTDDCCSELNVNGDVAASFAGAVGNAAINLNNDSSYGVFVDGDLTVNWSGYGGEAGVHIDANGGTVQVDGDVNITLTSTAEGDGGPIDGHYIVGQESSLDQVEQNGAVNVTVNAFAGEARAELYADGDIAVTNTVTVSENGNQVGPDTAKFIANANGDIELATVTVTELGELAHALIDVDARGDIFANGDLTATAGAEEEGENFDALAEVHLTAGYGGGEGDLTLTGDLTVSAINTSSDGNAEANVELSANGNSGYGGSIFQDGDVTVTAVGSSANFSAFAYGGDFVADGDTTVSAEGLGYGGGAEAFYGVAAFGNGGYGGFFGGNIDQNGSVDVSASSENGGNARFQASAYGGDFTAAGNTRVEAEALGYGGSSSANYDAFAVIGSFGYGGVVGGSIFQDGDVTVTAVGSEASFNANAYGGDFVANGDTTVSAEGLGYGGSAEAVYRVGAFSDGGYGGAINVNGNVTVSAVNTYGGAESFVAFTADQAIQGNGLVSADELDINVESGGTPIVDLRTKAMDIEVGNVDDLAIDNFAEKDPVFLSILGGLEGGIDFETGGDLEAQINVEMGGDAFIGAAGDFEASDMQIFTNGTIDLVAGGDLDVSNANLSASYDEGLFLAAGGDVYSGYGGYGGGASLFGGMVGVFAGGDVLLGDSTVNVGDHADPSRHSGDPAIVAFLNANLPFVDEETEEEFNFPPQSSTPNAFFIAQGNGEAEGVVAINQINMDGDYLWLQGNIVELGGWSGPETILAQILPSNAASFHVEQDAGELEGVVYSYNDLFNRFGETTFALGASFLPFNVVIGEGGEIFFGDANVIIGTNGSVTGLGNIITDGLVAVVGLRELAANEIGAAGDLLDEDYGEDDDDDDDEEEAGEEGDTEEGGGGDLVEEEEAGEDNLECG